MPVSTATPSWYMPCCRWRPAGTFHCPGAWPIFARRLRLDAEAAGFDEAAFLARTGNGINQQLIAAKLRWLERHEPQVFGRIATVERQGFINESPECAAIRGYIYIRSCVELTWSGENHGTRQRQAQLRAQDGGW